MLNYNFSKIHDFLSTLLFGYFGIYIYLVIKFKFLRVFIRVLKGNMSKQVLRQHMKQLLSGICQKEVIAESTIILEKVNFFFLK